MKYHFTDEQLEIQPIEWNKYSGKSALQYAVGALLYMPATYTKIAKKIINSDLPNVKSLVLCLEDSIGDDMVEKAENDVILTLETIHKAVMQNEISINELPLIFIRVRTPHQITMLGNRMGESVSVLTGFVIPKVDKDNVQDYVDAFKTALESSLCKHIYLMPVLESRGIMYRQTRREHLHVIDEALKAVSDHVLNIRVGGSDFSHIYAIRRSVSDTIWEIGVVADCLSDIINYFGRNYVVSAAVWEYYGTETCTLWLEGIKREMRLDKLNGFIGKTAIHPKQLPVIQAALVVSYEEYRDATNILGMSEGVTSVQTGYGNNKMNEVKTHINWAKRIMGLAEIFGVRKNSANDEVAFNESMV